MGFSAYVLYAAVFGRDFVLTGRVDLIANAKDYVGGSCQPSWTLLSVLFLFERIIDLRSGLRRVLKSLPMARRRCVYTASAGWCLVLHLHCVQRCPHTQLEQRTTQKRKSPERK